MADRGGADLTVGRPALAVQLPAAPMTYCEFIYTWDSATSVRRVEEFARERPECEYVDLRIVIDGVPVDLKRRDLLALKRRHQQ